MSLLVGGPIFSNFWNFGALGHYRILRIGNRCPDTVRETLKCTTVCVGFQMSATTCSPRKPLAADINDEWKEVLPCRSTKEYSVRHRFEQLEPWSIPAESLCITSGELIAKWLLVLAISHFVCHILSTKRGSIMAYLKTDPCHVIIWNNEFIF